MISLRNVFPCPSRLCVSYCALCDAVIFSYNRCASGVRSNLWYIRIFQLVAEMLFAFRAATPSFVSHIYTVVSLGSKKQMIRIAASRIVTTMQNEFIRLYTMMKLVSDPVGILSFVFHAKFAVASRAYTPRPRPTFFGSSFVHLFPKSFSQWSAFIFPRKRSHSFVVLDASSFGSPKSFSSAYRSHNRCHFFNIHLGMMLNRLGIVNK